MLNALLNPGTLAVLLIFGLPIVAIICSTISSIARSKEKQQKSSEDTKVMQEIHQGLSRMEKRIEALETILFDQN